MGSISIDVALLVGAVLALALVLSVAQAFIGARVGSDHPVHVFLIRGIRSNGYRLFVTVPHLLNVCHCAAIPLYLHWIVSHFRTRAVFWCERLLNPIVNTLHVGLFAGMASYAAFAVGLPWMFVGLATALFAMTPQFFHALSARNFGLSSRGTGLLLLTLFYIAAFAVEAGESPMASWLALALAGWLIWGFSTFGQQALVILSLLLFVLTGRFVPLLGALMGLTLFIVLHPRYSLSYLRHTLRFIRTYATELAPIYILNRRASIWRDLVWDIWIRFREGSKSAIHYAYENSILVVLLLNPMVVLATWGSLGDGSPANPFLAYGSALSTCGLIAFVLTSFRFTRFLGEPERYVEVVTPWAALSASVLIYTQVGTVGLWVLLSCFLLTDVLQVFASKVLLKHVTGNEIGLNEIEKIVTSRFGQGARFCSNNEQFTKKLMHNEWSFAYYLAAGQDYCGLKASDVFSKFPFLRRDSCEKIVQAYAINACLLDRKLYDTIFDSRPAALRGMNVAWESDRFRLIVLDWASATGTVARNDE